MGILSKYERKAQRGSKKMVAFVRNHALVFAIGGWLLYIFVLKQRAAMGYFDYPLLNAASELLFWGNGLVMSILFGIGGAAVGKRRYKRRKK